MLPETPTQKTSGDPLQRVDSVRRGDELCGTGSAWECDPGTGHANYEPADAGTRNSGGVVVSAAGGAGASGVMLGELQSVTAMRAWGRQIDRLAFANKFVTLGTSATVNNGASGPSNP